MTDAVARDALSVIGHTLRPGGRLVAHVVIDAEGWRSEAEWRQDASFPGLMKFRYGLNCFTRTALAATSLVEAAGFRISHSTRCARSSLIHVMRSVSSIYLLPLPSPGA